MASIRFEKGPAGSTISSMLEAIAKLLANAGHVAVLTGAGVSAESGVPTFRDAQGGFWAQYRPEDLATPQAFVRNPKLVWDWYAWRREQLRGIQPNPGHLALVEIERRALAFSLITQNVDGLHQRAGSSAPIELHGSIARVKCFDEGTVVDRWNDAESPPRCACGAYLRPDVVWFGEALPAAGIAMAFEACGKADVFLSIGTSALVHPAASLPLEALRHGAVLVEINKDETPLTPHAKYSLRGKSGELLPRIVSLAFPS